MNMSQKENYSPSPNNKSHTLGRPSTKKTPASSVAHRVSFYEKIKESEVKSKHATLPSKFAKKSKKEAEDLEQKETLLEKEISQLKSLKEGAEKEYRTKISELQQKLEDEQQNSKKLFEETEDLRSVVKMGAAEVEKLYTELESEKESCIKFEQQCEELKTQLTSLSHLREKENKGSNEKIRNLQIELITYRERENLFDQETLQRESELQALKSELESLRSVKSLLASKEEELELVKEEIVKLRDEYDVERKGEQSNAEFLEKEVEELKRVVSMEVQTSKAEVEDLKQTLRAVTREKEMAMEELMSFKNSLQSNSISMSLDTKILHEQLFQTQKKLTQANSELEKYRKNSSDFLVLLETLQDPPNKKTSKRLSSTLTSPSKTNLMNSGSKKPRP